MAKYRRRFDILADVVRVTGSGARRTKIMYFANLSYLLLKRYLDDAVHIGFLREIGDEFAATSKGEKFLERYQQFTGKYSSIKADLEALQCEAEELDRLCRPRGLRRQRNAKKTRLAILARAR
jgi:predicted transcriptional regulator